MHGHYELSRKNYVGAITDFNEYLAQNPDSLDVRNRVGYCHMKAEQPDKAISSFRQVLTQDKDNTYAILQLGLAWLQKGDPEQTIAIWLYELFKPATVCCHRIRINNGRRKAKSLQC